MNVRNYSLLFIIVIIFLFVFYLFTQRVETTIQYFPLDETASIDDAITLIQQDDKSNMITWDVHSTGTGPIYLRQDVSVLYANGQFKGLLNQWKQQKETITMNQSFALQEDTLLQAISFHHGELHDESGDITSIQKMTQAELELFSTTEKESTGPVPYFVEQPLLDHWEALMQHFKYTTSDYDILPLVDLATYDDRALPGRTLDATKKIVGQLWEGLYKNYIISLTTYTDNIPPHWMPVILLAKDQSHLIVLYEIDGKKHQLIQNIK